MNVQFNMTLLARPGCPAPLTNVFTGTTLGSPGAPLCSSLAAPAPVALQNVAVPGARVLDIFSNHAPGGGTNQLTALLLGGSTQLQAARVSAPTFVTVWIGNNEVLGAALTGNAAAATPAEIFAERYQNMVDSVLTLPIQGALLIGVVNVSRIPALSPGVAYFAAQQQGALPPSFTVDPNCGLAAAGGMGESTLVPFTYGFARLYAGAAAGESVTLNCVDDPPVLTGTEVATLTGLVESYNGVIAAEAAEHDWAYLDPNPVLDSLRAAGEIPPFPNAPPSPLAVTQPFGKWLSLDGVHPSALAHRLIANHVIDQMNRHYGTTVPRHPQGAGCRIAIPSRLKSHLPRSRRVRYRTGMRPIPPLFFLLALLAMIALHLLAPVARWLGPPASWLGLPVIALGLAMILAGALTLSKEDTPIHPFEPPTALVTGGLYRFSRNPIYLGMVIVLTGVALLLGTLTPLFVIPLFAYLIQRQFIRAEEDRLADAFGARYREYQARVRRWL